MSKIRVAIVGYGNIGKYALEALETAPDMEVAGIVRRNGSVDKPAELAPYQVVKHIKDLENVDVAILATPTRKVEEYAKECLALGINTVDSFDIHGQVLALRASLDKEAKAHQAASIISAGWDPGTDSVVRALMLALAPKGITYTNFGPGMSMGHTVAVKAIDGVKAALSMTIPVGTGIHRRMVYIELEEGYEFEDVAAAIQPGYKADESLARNFAKAYAGMTVPEFYDYAIQFGQKKTSSFNNMAYGEGFYLPMVELVKYLYDNGFTIYVISGTERTTTRAIIANSPIKDYVTPDHVIGTDFEVKVKGYEDVSSNMDFKYVEGDDLVLTGGFIQKDLNANKSIYIEREIGQRPVLAFGNSGSDTSMMNYAIDSRNPYPAKAFMIIADDNQREWGNPDDWASKSEEYAGMGYTPISMKDDFAQIYPDGITKGAQQYTASEWGVSEEQAKAA